MVDSPKTPKRPGPIGVPKRPSAVPGARRWVTSERVAGSQTEFMVLPRPPPSVPTPAPTPPAAPPPSAPPQQQPALGVGPPTSGPVAIRGPRAVAAPPQWIEPPPSDLGAESFRVYAVLLAMCTAVCVALLTTVGLLIFAFLIPPVPELVPLESPEIVEYEPIRDTAEVEERVLTEPVRPPVRPVPVGTSTRPGGGNSPAEKVEPSAPVEPPAGAGPLTVRIPANMFASEFEVSCPDAWRERGRFVNSVAVVPDVPVGQCHGRFKGGSINSKIPIRSGGGSLNCTALGPSSVVCK